MTVARCMQAWCVLAGLSFGGLAALPQAWAAPASPLQPHVAVYDLAMSFAEPGSGIEDITGRLVLELSQDCEGYVTNQRFVTSMTNQHGRPIVVDYSISSWESLDGLSYRFNLSQEVNGKSTERFEGTATLKGDGAGGEAVFTTPSDKITRLPKGTQFPTHHVVTLLQALDEKKPSVNITIFDGSGDTGLYDTFAVFGRSRTHEDALSKELGLGGLPARPVRISFFPIKEDRKEAAEIPDVEVGFDIYPDGVADMLDFNYGDFRLTGRMQSLELLEKVSCP